MPILYYKTPEIFWRSFPLIFNVKIKIQTFQVAVGTCSTFIASEAISVLCIIMSSHHYVFGFMSFRIQFRQSLHDKYVAIICSVMGKVNIFQLPWRKISFYALSKGKMQSREVHIPYFIFHHTQLFVFHL